MITNTNGQKEIKIFSFCWLILVWWADQLSKFWGKKERNDKSTLWEKMRVIERKKERKKENGVREKDILFF